jgi:N-acetyl-gamma-glutamyl-phosphate reductase
MSSRVFIDGAAGTTGLEIRQRLTACSAIDIIQLDDAQRKLPAARKDAMNAADIVIMCLPDEAVREALLLIESPHVRVIDASSANRVAHNWVYGFPELIGQAEIVRAQRVSNPGCYATGFLALVAPLVRAGFLAQSTLLSCNAVSGYSGGGKAMIARYEGGDAQPAWSGYALTLAHKHLPEMQAYSGLYQPPLFAPAVVPAYRGMVVDVPLHFPKPVDVAGLRDIYAQFYRGCALVRLVELGAGAGASTFTIEQAAGSDRIDIAVCANAAGTQVRLVAALDNLGKGAAGQAVQNLNIMLGLPEATGLRV